MLVDEIDEVKAEEDDEDKTETGGDISCKNASSHFAIADMKFSGAEASK